MARRRADGLGRVPAVEVLIRLDDGLGRATESAEFLRPAARYQMMPQIDRWVINAALAAISTGEIKLPAHRSCAINLSGQSLGDDEILEFIEE